MGVARENRTLSPVSDNFRVLFAAFFGHFGIIHYQEVGRNSGVLIKTVMSCLTF